MADDVLIRVEGISKKFCRDLKRSLWYGMKDTVADLFGRDAARHHLRHDEFWAVDNVSFELRRGECLGLIGRNGAGKTTLLKMLNGLIKPDRGRIEMRGRVGALIALGAGFNPILTGRENIYINGAVLGLSKKDVDAKYDDIVDFAEIGEFINAPVQSYSSGMQVRLGFAIATAMELDILLLDEVLAVGDAKFRAKCHQRIGTVLTSAAVILVSHNPYHIKKNCSETLLLQKGAAIARGTPDTVLRLYEEDNNNGELESLKILDDNVIRAEIQCMSETLNHGETLQVRILIELESPARCDQGYLNIVDQAGNVHAQAILTEHPLELREGQQEIAISIGPLCLSEGKFYGSLIMLTSGGKRTLLQFRNIISFVNRGPISIGPFYYPPAAVDVRKTEIHRQVSFIE